ncbi:PstS family phosphate ABC transporter substrate-binding protein [Novipirellula artificiosorum]|uniref:PstS family phosphate ABC transporter substrate-binding protein n=1 Tax=Novipirellula artificiosorum TaxID=2528016 RepID=UPI0018CF57A2|nr:substrate-binding domain-containing protein [Novipirellula artificiosorum]
MFKTPAVPLLLFAVFSFSVPINCRGDESSTSFSVQEIRSLLNSITPYLPGQEVSAEVDIFGSTSMDALAHGWAGGFKKFHPKATVVISAEGSETAVDRLTKNPASIGMFSRPVSEEELEKLKLAGLENPAAVMVAREALGVFVNESNPLKSINREQFLTLFCVPDGETPSEPMVWSSFGASGGIANEPVEIIARGQNSGTQIFLQNYVFGGQVMREAKASYASNAKVVQALEEDKNAIGICGLKCGSHSLRLLGLQANDTIIPCDDHSVLMGRYPLIRPLTLVLDLGQTGARADANREFVRYALHQAGQSQSILAGFFPFDPPTLRGERAKLEQKSDGSDK